MKIVSVMTTASAGGAEFAAVEMLDALGQAGHEVVMLSNQPAIGRETRVRVEPVELGPKLSTSTARSVGARLPVLLWRLRRALAAEAPFDVLLVHYKKEQLLARRLPDRLRPTLVWCEWGPVPLPFRSGLPRRLYAGAGRDADLVLAISTGTARSVAAQGVPPDRIQVVPNVLRVQDVAFDAEGRDRLRRRLGIPADAFVVGCVSRLDVKKRVDVLVEAVGGLDDERVHLLLAGDGERRGEHTRRARELLGDRAHVLDTPREDLVEVLSSFDVSVFCPSPTEGQPRATILGMLASRPVLSTGREGVADLITDEVGGIAARDHDASATAELLRRYLRDPDLGPRQGARAREVAERTFAAPVVARRIEDELRAVGAGS